MICILGMTIESVSYDLAEFKFLTSGGKVFQVRGEGRAASTVNATNPELQFGRDNSGTFETLAVLEVYSPASVPASVAVHQPLPDRAQKAFHDACAAAKVVSAVAASAEASTPARGVPAGMRVSRWIFILSKGTATGVPLRYVYRHYRNPWDRGGSAPRRH